MARDEEKYKAAQQKHYQENKDAYRLSLVRRRAERRAWFRNLKDNLKCERCPEDHPACLDFHHRDSREKEESISRMVRQALSEATILKEIEKCIVLCSNCHRKLHWDDEETHVGMV